MEAQKSIKKATAASAGALVTSLFITPLDVAKVRLQSQLNVFPGSQPMIVPERALNVLVENCPKSCICRGKLKRMKNQGIPKSKVLSSARLSSCARLCSNGPKKLHGTYHALRHIFQTEGISGLFSGLSPAMMIAIPSTVMYYMSYDMLLQEGKRRYPEFSPVLPLLSGSTSRIFAATITSPIELVRTRMQSDSSTSGVARTFQVAIRNEGYRSLFNGLCATLARDVPFSAIYWTFYEKIQARLVNKQDDLSLNKVQQAFIGGALSGVVAATCTTPFDVVKTLQQVETNAFTYPSGTAVLRRVIESRGLRGAFVGLTARLARVAPSCAIMISTYEFGKQKLGILE
jgi:solute carrier family 25 protein 39/40